MNPEPDTDLVKREAHCQASDSGATDQHSHDIPLARIGSASIKVRI